MAFSFSPGQQPQAVPQPQGAPAQAPQPSSAMVATTAQLPSIPDSPFLFMQHRGQEMTVNAYLQIMLILVAVTSIFLSIVCFAYTSYLSSSIASKKEQLASSDATFKTYPIDDMKKFYNRMSHLDKILQGYVSARSPLKLLEDVVEKQVFFNDFSLTKNDGGGYVVNFTVVTGNYRSLVQQLDALNLSEYKKVAPTPSLGDVNDGLAVVKVNVTTPVFVQGVLPDSIVFLSSSTSTVPSQGSVSSSSTPSNN
jgi:hypothetical protein